MPGYYNPYKGKLNPNKVIDIGNITKNSSIHLTNSGNNKCFQSLYKNPNITEPKPTKIIEPFIESFLSINNKYKNFIVIFLLVILYFVKKSCY